MNITNKEDFASGFGWGCFLMFLVCLIIVCLLFGENRPNLETCAKAHDVYECEWVAVPKKGSTP